MRTGVEDGSDRTRVMNLRLRSTGTTKSCRQSCRSIGGPAWSRNKSRTAIRFFHAASCLEAERIFKAKMLPLHIGDWLNKIWVRKMAQMRSVQRRTRGEARLRK